MSNEIQELIELPFWIKMFASPRFESEPTRKGIDDSSDQALKKNCSTTNESQNSCHNEQWRTLPNISRSKWKS